MWLWTQELDFLAEAKNSEKCLYNFQKLSPHIAEYIYAPKVHWNLSTSKLLTMEFIDGVQVNDVNSIQRLGVQPKDVAKLVSSFNFMLLELCIFRGRKVHISLLMYYSKYSMLQFACIWVDKLDSGTITLGNYN